MMQVVEQACVFQPGTGQGQVVIESDEKNFPLAIDELTGPDAKLIAIDYAARRGGLGDPRINGMASSAYAINAEGLPLEDVRDEHGRQLAQTHKRMQPARYRVNIPVTRRLL